jgi:hypothetical protein
MGPEFIDRRRTGRMERHFQTVMIGLITAALIAITTFAWNANAAFSRLDEQISQLSRDLNSASTNITALVNSAETKADHERDVTYQQRQLTDHELRLRSLETARKQR